MYSICNKSIDDKVFILLSSMFAQKKYFSGGSIPIVNSEQIKNQDDVELRISGRMLILIL